MAETQKESQAASGTMEVTEFSTLLNKQFKPQTEGAKKEVELERLRMAIRDNLITPEVRTNGFGAVDNARLEEGINQLALTTTFKAKPKAEAIFDSSFLAPLADRRAN